MSTPSYDRNEKETTATKTLNALVKAKELATYTIHICSNRTYFKEEYQDLITKDIVETAKNIYLDVDTANNVYVGNDPIRWESRRKSQESASSNCSRLLSLIGLAKEVFHLKESKSGHWFDMTMETKNFISAWKESDRKRYGNLSKTE